jgi:hypothetical protein
MRQPAGDPIAESWRTFGMAYTNFTALYLSLQRLGEVVDQDSLKLTGGAAAIALVPNDRLERGMAVGYLARATLKWLNKASLPTLDELITKGKLSDGAFFTHEGAFHGKGINTGATCFEQGKPPKVVPTLHTKLKAIAPNAILKVQVHPRNYTGDSASFELSGLHRLFLVARLTVSTPPDLEAQAYAIGHMHEQPMGLDHTVDKATLASLDLSERQEADYKEFEYRCYDKVYFPGEMSMKRSNLIVVNGNRIKIPDSLFALFFRLAVELEKERGGWVDTQTLESEDVITDAQNYQRYSSLRALLQAALLGKNAEEFIQSDGSKHYRISTHPDFITYDRSKLRNHPDPKIMKIAQDLP